MSQWCTQVKTGSSVSTGMWCESIVPSTQYAQYFKTEKENVKSNKFLGATYL